MANAAVIENGKVARVIVVDTDAQGAIINFPADGLVLSDVAAVGDTYTNGQFVRPPVEVIPPSVPTSVTPRQARLALLAAGLLDKVEAAVTSAGGATKVTWDYAAVINRSDTLISTIGTSLNLTSDQIDVLFKYAATQ